MGEEMQRDILQLKTALSSAELLKMCVKHNSFVILAKTICHITGRYLNFTEQYSAYALFNV